MEVCLKQKRHHRLHEGRVSREKEERAETFAKRDQVLPQEEETLKRVPFKNAEPLHCSAHFWRGCFKTP
jgi:hypothetical protein